MGASPVEHSAHLTDSALVWGSADGGVKALRSVLQARLHGGADDGELRRAIGVVCGEARRRRLHVEQVIVAVKRTWYSLPDVRDLSSGEGRADLLDHVIRLTIDEFYAGRG